MKMTVIIHVHNLKRATVKMASKLTGAASFP